LHSLTSADANKLNANSSSYNATYSNLWLNDNIKHNTNSNILNNNTVTNSTNNISNINTNSLSNLTLNYNDNNSLFNLNKSSDVNNKTHQHHQYEKLVEDSNSNYKYATTSANQKSSMPTSASNSNSSSSETITPSLNHSSILNSERNEKKSYVNIEKLKFQSTIPKFPTAQSSNSIIQITNTNPYVTKIMTTTSPTTQNQAYISTISTNRSDSPID